MDASGQACPVDFETGDISRVTWTEAVDVGVDLAVQGAVKRSGSYALHAVCLSSEPALFNHEHRSEVGFMPYPSSAVASPSGQPRYVLGEWWYGMSFYIPASWSNDDSSCSNCGPEGPGRWHLLTQWPHDASVSPGDLAMQPLQLDVFDSTIRFEHFYGNASTSPVILWTAALNDYKGRWVDLVVHANWSTDPAVGFIQIWVDGAQVVDYHDHTAHPTGGGVKWKAGMTYSLDQSRDVYIDEMRMVGSAGSYSAVVPR